jgi:hypothetical protein
MTSLAAWSVAENYTRRRAALARSSYSCNFRIWDIGAIRESAMRLLRLRDARDEARAHTHARRAPQKRVRAGVTAAILALATLFEASPVRAQTSERGTEVIEFASAGRSELWRRGIDAFAAADYAVAAKAFEALYARFRDVDALFNLAQTFAKRGDCRGAQAGVRAFLTERPGTVRDNARWKSLETACPELIGGLSSPTRAAAVPAADAALAPTQAAAASPATQTALDGGQAVPASEPVAPSPPIMREQTSPRGLEAYLAWGLVGLGAAEAVGAVAFAVASHQTAKKVEEVPRGADYSAVKQLDAQGKRENTAAVGLAIAAGVTAGVGVFLLLSEKPQPEAKSYELRIGVAPGGAAVLFGGNF